MSRIEPFKAVFYTAAQGAPHLHAAPPYDIISAREHAALLAASPRNIVRFTLGERPDAAPDFSRARERLAAWVRDGVLAVGAAPRYYLYTADFTHDGTSYAFTGLVGKVDLAAARVRGHEKTFAKVKEGRLAQLAGVGGNLELVFLVCEDDGAFLKLMREGRGARRLTVPAGEGETHAVCDLEDAAAAHAAALLASKDLVIADGHHRFQTAARYWEENPGVAGARYCLAVVGSMAPAAGLRIAPYHRAITFPSRQRAREWALAAAAALPAAAGAADVTLYFPGAEDGLARGFRGGGESLIEYLHKNFIDTLPADASLECTRDLTAAVERLRRGAPIVAVRVRAVTPEDLFSTVKAGKVFPPKSTYFYPKLWSGMIMRLFEFDG